MALPSLDQLRRNAEKLRADVAGPPEERGYPFGYVPPELEEMYEEWRERDPDAALIWRMQQPGFSFPEMIRRCCEHEDEIAERIRQKREAGELPADDNFDDDDEDLELGAGEPSESGDLDRLVEPEVEERENQAVDVEADGPQTASVIEDDREPAPEPLEPPQARDQTRTPNQATPGSPWNPHPRQSLRDQLKGW